MYVHSITEFIETLRAQEDLESYDKKFLDDIATTFLEHDGLTSLDSTQIEFLVEIFNRRWNNIKDTPKDYTLCDDFINRVWAKLAEELASELRISFISVLIPSIKNRIDPITFTKLPSNYTELQQLYLSHDNSTIHSLNNLVTRFKEGNYSTYGDIRKVKPRALSPLEMSRIRAKVTGLPIVCDSQCYTNFWSFVTDRVFPLWQKEGELPSMVSSLSDVVQSYYENDLNTSDGVYRFRKDLITWSENLLCYPLKEVNHLYGISITISPFSSRYLAEILSDALLVNPILIGESIKAIAIWLALRDPSLIIRTPALQATYFELRVGPGFGAREFLEGIKTLFGNDDKRFERELTALMVSVQEKIQSTEEQFVIDPSDLQRLKIIYGQRWEIIRGGVLDYTQTQTGSNSNWIRLAQLLAGAGYLSYNYYLFLMPSIRREFEPISLETISRYPLSHYILSESGRDLIFLGTCAAADGRLFNFNQASPSELTTLERNRILCADGRYLNLLDKRCPEDPPISIRTVNAIKRVLDDCLYARDEAQKLASEYALLEFYPFLRQISEDEKQRLYAQKINYRGAVYSFKNIMEEIEKGECITAHLRCLVRLVVDYLPDAKFSLQVESKVPLAEIRKYSARKVLREYEDIDVQEVKTRLLIILFSLLTHEFDYLPLTGWKISACGRSNTVPKHVEPIFRLIAPLVTKNFKGVSAQRLRHIYGQIVEGVIKPTLEDNGWNSWFTLFEGTKAWMNSILSGTLFKNIHWYEPATFLYAFLPLTRTNSLKNSIEDFLDYVVQIHIHSENMDWQRLEVNFRFAQIIKNAETPYKTQILDLLAATKLPKDQRLLSHLCMDLLIHRLATLGASICESSARFFGYTHRYSPEIYRGIKTKLEKLVGETESSLGEMLPILHRSLHCLAENTLAYERIVSYWQTMTSQMVKRMPIEGDVMGKQYVSVLA